MATQQRVYNLLLQKARIANTLLRKNPMVCLDCQNNVTNPPRLPSQVRWVLRMKHTTDSTEKTCTDIDKLKSTVCGR